MLALRQHGRRTLSPGSGALSTKDSPPRQQEVKRTYRLPPELDRRLAESAARARRSVNGQVVVLLERGLQESSPA